jgi:hypothetical protein
LFLEPRVAFLASGEHTHFKVGAGIHHQNMHLLTNDGLGLPTDIWIPANNVLEPQKSWMINAAFGYRSDGGYQFGGDIYYKKLSKISSSFKEGAEIAVNEAVDWEALVPTGEGKAVGFEIYAEKEVGSNVFTTNYTYSTSTRTFPDLNTGRVFDFGYNRRHSFKFSYIFRLSKFSEFLVNWTYQSGAKFSMPENITINPNGAPVVLFLDKNNASFPDFHRMDVGFTFFSEYKRSRTKLFLGAFNAYNRSNPFYTELKRDVKEPGRFNFVQIALPGFTPTISYSLVF